MEPGRDFRILVHLLSYCFLIFENETQITMCCVLVLIDILKCSLYGKIIRYASFDVLSFCVQSGFTLCQTAIKSAETIKTNKKVARVVVT